ncbi:MAG: hypothetical protein Harvfovirus4_48 [Harvfovirus sp.]|uniref:ATP-dependent Clp protease proteolytic subunit n=1 Tax=Harvfovirus sp. TaxID=2487768 RepID=A0A3G5A2F4_9VIRU|nr:MAG: hypothetical protein Harvfovirus4_48 [Harvfovirus sp.]
MSDIGNIIWGSKSRMCKRKLSVVSDDDVDYDATAGIKRKAKVEKKPSLAPKHALEEDHSSSSSGLIYSRNNHVHYYADVTLSNITSLQKEIDTVIETLSSKSLLVKVLDFDIKFPPIVLHINSPGGSIFAAFMFIDYMTQVKRKYPDIKFHSVVEGRAASAATLISVTTDKRFISEYGYMLIHQLSSVSMGKYNELKDDMVNSDKLMERIKQIYKKHTKVPQEQLDEILSHDLYWDADTCKRYGLIDHIYESTTP